MKVNAGTSIGMLAVVVVTLGVVAVYLLGVHDGGTVAQASTPAVPVQQEAGVIRRVKIGDDVELLEIYMPEPGFSPNRRCFVVNDSRGGIGHTVYSAPSCQ